jgi:hypothetical protein
MPRKFGFTHEGSREVTGPGVGLGVDVGVGVGVGVGLGLVVVAWLYQQNLSAPYAGSPKELLLQVIPSVKILVK